MATGKVYDLKSIFKNGTNTTYSKTNDDVTVIDKQWIMSRFMSPNSSLNNSFTNSSTGGQPSYIDRINRFSTSANFKYTDTSLGGNVAINSRPQYTLYCDVPAVNRASLYGGKSHEPSIQPEGKTNSLASGYGMGRYYSESIDDNQQHVYFEFGVPKFNSLIDFFTRAIDYESSILANTGTSPLAYSIGRTLGGVVMLAAFPMVTSFIWLAKTTMQFLTSLDNEPFSYYYVKPTPHMYWTTVSQIVTNMATEMGLLAPILQESKDDAHRIGFPAQLDNEHQKKLGDLLPGIFNSGGISGALAEKMSGGKYSNQGYIDVFAMATKVQQIADAQMSEEYNLVTNKNGNGTADSKTNTLTNKDYIGYVMNGNTPQEDKTAVGVGLGNYINHLVSFSTYLSDDKLNKSGYTRSDLKQDQGATPPATPPTPPATTNGTTTTTPTAQSSDNTTSTPATSLPEISYKKNADGTYPKTGTPEAEAANKTWLQKFADATDAAIRDGGRYAVFAVDYVGSVSESFSNSTGEISSGQALKQIGGKVRDVKFDLAGGNLSNTIGDILKTGQDLLAGVLDSVTFGASSVLAALTGGGFVDLPKKWEDSDTSFPQITYTMQLVSPYGNVFSQLQNMYIPLAMLMAGTLPLATGKASYTSPYICKLYNKGVQKINLGMITSLTITRGTSNLGFNKFKRPLAIDVSFTVTDFSSIVAAPVDDSAMGVFSPTLESVTPLSTYIATLASRDINTDRYLLNRLRMKASRELMRVDQMVSPASWGLLTGEKLNGILGGVVSDHSITLGDLNYKN